MKRDYFNLTALLTLAGLFVLLSGSTSEGAKEGLILAQEDVIPSLLPILIIFLLIMKTGARDALAKLFGFISQWIFNLPQVTFPAIFLGLLGGYPTGVLLTEELYSNEEIDSAQAKRIMSFNFCGGAGFIITTVGSIIYNSASVGLLLFASNILSSVAVGFALSFTQKRKFEPMYSYSQSVGISEVLNESVSHAVKSVLNITAYIILFSSFSQLVEIPQKITPLVEITNGVCSDNNFTLPLIAAYLSFGGACIHIQIFSSLHKMKISYIYFLLFRIINSILSYFTAKFLFYLHPINESVFSNNMTSVTKISSVNLTLSVLLILGCVVLILDLDNKRKAKL